MSCNKIDVAIKDLKTKEYRIISINKKLVSEIIKNKQEEWKKLGLEPKFVAIRPEVLIQLRDETGIDYLHEIFGMKIIITGDVQDDISICFETHEAGYLLPHCYCYSF